MFTCQHNNLTKYWRVKQTWIVKNCNSPNRVGIYWNVKIFIDIKQAQNDAFKASDADRHELLNTKLKQIIDPNRFSDIFADYKTDTIQAAFTKLSTSKE